MVPDALLAATARAAAGQGNATAVAALTAKVIRAMLATKLKAAAAVLLGVAALASAGWSLAARGSEGEKPPAAAPPSVLRVVAPPKDEPGATVAVRGIVVDPAGRPVERATVRFFDPLERGKDGRTDGAERTWRPVRPPGTPRRLRRRLANRRQGQDTRRCAWPKGSDSPGTSCPGARTALPR